MHYSKWGRYFKYVLGIQSISLIQKTEIKLVEILKHNLDML